MLDTTRLVEVNQRRLVLIVKREDGVATPNEVAELAKLDAEALAIVKRLKGWVG